MWIRDNEPEVYAKTYKTLNAKDFIVLRLTGNYYTEPSDATSNGCIDLNTLQWSEKIVNISGIDGDKLPEIVPSTHVAGYVTKKAAEETGLAVGTPVVMDGGAKGPVWRQMMADIYNAKITVPVQLEEATSMGAAVTGGVGVGIFKNFTAIDSMLEINSVVEPNPIAHAAYAPVKEAFEVFYEAMKPVYEYMASKKVEK